MIKPKLGREKASDGVAKDIWRDRAFYILVLPALLLTFVFSYLPMLGIAMSFKDYDYIKGFWASDWVGLKHIMNIFVVPSMREAVVNTIYLNLLTILVCFFAPVVFALLLNEISGKVFKRIAQTVSYLPHFLSWISVVAIVYNLMGTSGIINDIRVALLGETAERIAFMAEQNLFIPNYIIINLWKTIGWESIIYLAAISGADQQLYEAAAIDGANRFHQTWHITLPVIMPTIVILFILRCGSIFGSNFELVYGLQNPYVQYDVISTVVYRSGIQQANYSASTALSLVQGVFSLILVMSANFISRKVNDVSLW